MLCVMCGKFHLSYAIVIESHRTIESNILYVIISRERSVQDKARTAENEVGNKGESERDHHDIYLFMCEM